MWKILEKKYLEMNRDMFEYKYILLAKRYMHQKTNAPKKQKTNMYKNSVGQSSVKSEWDCMYHCLLYIIH